MSVAVVKPAHILLVPRNFSRGRGVVPSLAKRGEQSCQRGYSSLECSVLKCGQMYSTLCCLTTLQDATFQTGSTHADKTAPPAPREIV
jgi:hypothetical protein